ncbi:MAG: hypothetical protein K6U03_03075 [Firmicutes bacterium]|nr:hypothetical protein [Bacillota bacterium]
MDQLWLAVDREKLSTRAREAIREHAGELFVSSISAFEIALKARRGKLELPMEPGVWFKQRGTRSSWPGRDPRGWGDRCPGSGLAALA